MDSTLTDSKFDDLQNEGLSECSSGSKCPLSMTLLELISVSDVSVRLHNCITVAFSNCKPPINTIGDYLAAGSNAIPKMLKIQNFGRRTAYELDELVKKASEGLIIDDPLPTSSESTPFVWNGMELSDSTLDYPILDLVNSRFVPQRLKNCIELNIHCDDFPFINIRDYLIDNGAGVAQMLKFQNFGRKSANDLRELISNYLTDQVNSQGDNGETSDIGKDVHETVCDVISLLKDNERQTLILRYGLDGHKKHTLEEIGLIFDVTRARIGQIEDKALRKLRLPVYKDIVSKSLIFDKEHVVSLFECTSGIILDKDINRSRLSGEYALALDIVGWSLTSFLSKYLYRFTKGWVREEALIVELHRFEVEISTAIVGRHFPISLESLDIAFEDFPHLPISVALSAGLSNFKELIFDGKVGRRKKRQARLFEMLHRGYQHLDDLTAEYNKQFPEERCSCRDALIVMADAPHLFLSLGDQGWAAICNMRPDKVNIITESNSACEINIDSEETSFEISESNSLVEFVRRTLMDRGPMHFVELREYVLAVSGNSYSRASLGPILIANDEFVRVAPGVYGLRIHFEGIEPADNYGDLLLNEADCQFYVMARWAGEKLFSFPLWTPTMEYEWCKWARSGCDKAIYSSLIYIANPYYWPVDDNVVEHWLEIKRRDGNYSLMLEHKHPLADYLPTLREVYAVLLVVEKMSSMNWIRVNRILGRRINDFHAASMMALLVGLGAVNPTSHWQSSHSKGDHLKTQLQRLSNMLIRSVDQTWSSNLGQEVLRELKISINNIFMGWVETDQFNVLIEELSISNNNDITNQLTEDQEEFLSPMDFLLSQMNRRNREAQFADLIEELAGE